MFAHGSGSSRHSVRNIFVARELQKAGMATLLMDLLTEEEEIDRGHVFDIQLLAQRLISAKAWLSRQPKTSQLPIWYFGASHLFEEPETLQQVARRTINWFTSHVPSLREKAGKPPHLKLE